MVLEARGKRRGVSRAALSLKALRETLSLESVLTSGGCPQSLLFLGCDSRPPISASVSTWPLYVSVPISPLGTPVVRFGPVLRQRDRSLT